MDAYTSAEIYFEELKKSSKTSKAENTCTVRYQLPYIRFSSVAFGVKRITT